MPQSGAIPSMMLFPADFIPAVARAHELVIKPTGLKVAFHSGAGESARPHFSQSPSVNTQNRPGEVRHISYAANIAVSRFTEFCDPRLCLVSSRPISSELNEYW